MTLEESDGLVFLNLMSLTRISLARELASIDDKVYYDVGQRTYKNIAENRAIEGHTDMVIERIKDETSIV